MSTKTNKIPSQQINENKKLFECIACGKKVKTEHIIMACSKCDAPICENLYYYAENELCGPCYDMKYT